MTRVLTVGVTYTDTKFPVLDRSKADATNIADFFQDIQGANSDCLVHSLVDPQRVELADAVEWLATARHELVVFYFSGHARLSTKGGSAFILRDSNAARPHSLLSAQDVGQQLSSAEGCTIVLIFDCCFAEDLARDIREQLGWKPDGLVCLLSSQAGMLTLQPKSEKDDGAFLYSERNSIFTRSILLALAGLCTVSQDLDLIATTRLAHFEAVRLHSNPPTLMSQGLSSHFIIPTVKGSAVDSPLTRRVPLYGSGLESSASEEPVNNIAVQGSLGALADHHGALLGGALSRQAFAQGPATFVLSANTPKAFTETALLRGLDRLATLNYVAGVRGGRIVASVGSSPLPELLAAFDEHSVVPRLDPGHLELAIRRLAGLPASDRVIDALDTICEISGDSLERGVATAVSLASVLDPRVTREDLVQVNSEALSGLLRRRSVGGVFKILYSAPNIDLSAELLTEFVSHLHGISRSEAADAVEQVRRAGWVIGSRSLLWMPPAVREFVTDAHLEAMPYESTFESWLEWSLATTAGFRRRQVFAALCAALEDRTFRTPVVVDALQRAGRELAYWAGPRATTSLFGDVLNDPEYEKAPLLWLRLGDAKRLMDDYPGARDAFNGALNLAVREIERSEATIGIASAVKNLDGGTTQLEAMLQDLDPVSRLSGGTPQVAARALFQRGNLLFSSSRWVDALSAYSEAEELLDKRDWTHASLLLDVWKGKGDIHLHRGDIEAASELLTISLDLAGARATTGVDGRAHAKLSQYAGDVWRHGMFGGAAFSRMAPEGALWWYALSEDLYSANGLELGTLITRFRRAQVDFGLGHLDEALADFSQLRRRFAALRNALWELKTDVMICLICRESELPLERLGRASLLNVSRCEGEGNLSSYQAAWAGLALGAVQPSIDLFARIGALGIADRLQREGPGVWLGSEY